MYVFAIYLPPFHCCICLSLNMFVHYMLFVCLFVLCTLTPPACGLSLSSIKLCSVLFCLLTALRWSTDTVDDSTEVVY